MEVNRNQENCFACFDTTKERLKSEVNTFAYVLQNLRVNGLQGLVIGFPCGQVCLLRVVVGRGSRGFKSVFAFSQKTVIQSAARLNRRASGFPALWSEEAGI